MYHQALFQKIDYQQFSHFIHQVASVVRRLQRTLWSSNQVVTCPFVYHTQRLHIVPLNAEHQAGKLRIPSVIVFSLTQP